jgi:hypothetical protein
LEKTERRRLSKDASLSANERPIDARVEAGIAEIAADPGQTVPDIPRMEPGSSQICDGFGFLTSVSMQTDCHRRAGGPNRGLRRVLTNAQLPNASGCRNVRRRPRFGDETQDVGEEVSRNCDLRHLKRDIATVAHDLRADLDQLLFEAGQRPILDRFGRDDVRVDVINLMTRVDDLPAFAAAFVLGSPLADQIRARGLEPQTVIAEVESALRERALKDGCAPLRAILFDAATE